VALQGLASGAYDLHIAAAAQGVPGTFTLALATLRSDEREPDETALEASPFTGNAPVLHELSSPGDVDVWRIEDAAGRSLRAWTWHPAGTCPTDTHLELLAPDGATVLAAAPSHPRGAPCAGLFAPWARGATALAPGQHFLRVRGDQGAQGPYPLVVMLLDEVPPFEVEPDDTPSQAVALAAPDGVVAATVRDDDTDVFALTLPAAEGPWNVGARIDDGLGGCAGPVALALLAPDGLSVAGETPVAACAAIDPLTDLWARDFPAAATFYLRVRGEGGDYALHHAVDRRRYEREPNDGPSIAEPVQAPDDGRVAALSPAGDEDWFAVTLTGPSILTLSTDDGAGGCAVDTVVELWAGAGGELLLRDDDDGPGACSHLRALLPTPGVYTLRIYGFAPDVTGRYVLHAAAEAGPSLPVEREPNDDASRAQGPFFDDVVVAARLTAGDADWYELVLARRGGPTPVRVFTGDGLGGCHTDTVIDVVAADAVTRVTTDDDGGAGACSEVSVALAPGPWFVVVRGFSAAVAGPYVVHVDVE
jgi:hypothetical protein